jgi:Kef-type K+ transport system membrane component KefB
MQIFLLMALTCLVVVTIGYFINKYLHLPWMFTVVILGMTLSSLGLFTEVLQSENFQLLAKMGMLLFLFTIGLDLELEQIRKLGGYIVFGNILLTLSEGFLLALLFYFVYPDFVSHSFGVALLTGIAFGTVGEVILLALLKEFGLEKTKFGQLALGIGVFDDIFEILVLAIIIGLPALTSTSNPANGWDGSFTIVITLTGIILATIFLSKIGKFTRSIFEKIPSDSFVPPFLIFMFSFGFIYLGSYRIENMGVVAAIFSGIAIKKMLPEKTLQQWKKPVFFVTNIFLGPFFFLSLGGKMSLGAVISNPLLILAIITISLASRVAISYLLFQRLHGKRQAAILGVGLTAKFSTSVISENLLYTSGMIALPLYSTIMAAFILLKPIIVGAFSMLLATHKESIHEVVDHSALSATEI